ncbi:hypothetical protein J2Z19_001545 [Ensifer adhaerens]|uniref:Uncharacterized protein n=1 Tax=Ensifer adhaerens TaxID=106592 RepID=A0ACC5SSR0_ENSAD|nr:hypothetical protein [Ensifer adhaerens]MBP1871833.1 hypothetical protein [Ensifer adhaerens]
MVPASPQKKMKIIQSAEYVTCAKKDINRARRSPPVSRQRPAKRLSRPKVQAGPATVRTEHKADEAPEGINIVHFADHVPSPHPETAVVEFRQRPSSRSSFDRISIGDLNGEQSEK